MNTDRRADGVDGVRYGQLLDQIKAQVRTARAQAARVVNVELIVLYWQIGHLILDRQASEGWGTNVIGRLAADLGAEFPGMRGLSRRNLVYMRTFAAAYREPVAQQPAAQLPWGHVMLLLDRVRSPAERDWYAARAVADGWSRATLRHHIATDRAGAIGAAPNTFSEGVVDPVPAADRDLLAELARDRYDLEFLALDPGYSERQLEQALTARLTGFLAELGAGFAFVGRQYRLPLPGRDYFADLLFYHLRLRRFVVFELKIGPAEPEHVGKLNFYVTAVDELLRQPQHGDGPTVGILLAGERDDVVVEYALRGVATPLAVSTYTTEEALPAELRAELPSRDELADLVRHTPHRPPLTR